MRFFALATAAPLVLAITAAPSFATESICPTTPAKPCVLSAGIYACPQKSTAERLRELAQHQDYDTADRLAFEMRCKVLNKGDKVIAEEFNLVGVTRLHLPGKTKALFSNYALEGSVE